MSKQPYEILLRGRDGVLVGAHVLDEPGSDARPIALADLADAIPAAQTLADASRLLAENKQLRTDLRECGLAGEALAKTNEQQAKMLEQLTATNERLVAQLNAATEMLRSAAPTTISPDAA